MLRNVGLREVGSSVLIAIGACASALAVVWAVQLPSAYEKAVRTDDWVGFSLGLHMLLYFILPTAACLFVGGALLRLPVRRQPAAAARHHTWRRLGSYVVWTIAIALFVESIRVVWANWPHSSHFHPEGFTNWPALVLLGLPLFTLAVLLAFGGRSLGREDPG